MTFTLPTPNSRIVLIAVAVAAVVAGAFHAGNFQATLTESMNAQSMIAVNKLNDTHVRLGAVSRRLSGSTAMAENSRAVQQAMRNAADTVVLVQTSKEMTARIADILQDMQEIAAADERDVENDEQLYDDGDAIAAAVEQAEAMTIKGSAPVVDAWDRYVEQLQSITADVDDELIVLEDDTNMAAFGRKIARSQAALIAAQNEVNRVAEIIAKESEKTAKTAECAVKEWELRAHAATMRASAPKKNVATRKKW